MGRTRAGHRKPGMIEQVVLLGKGEPLMPPNVKYFKIEPVRPRVSAFHIEGRLNQYVRNPEDSVTVTDITSKVEAMEKIKQARIAWIRADSDLSMSQKRRMVVQAGGDIMDLMDKAQLDVNEEKEE